jgi:hypothetical protein
MNELKEGFYELGEEEIYVQVHAGALNTEKHSIAVLSLYSKVTGMCYESFKVHRLTTENISNWKYVGKNRPYPPEIPRKCQ